MQIMVDHNLWGALCRRVSDLERELRDKDIFLRAKERDCKFLDQRVIDFWHQLEDCKELLRKKEQELAEISLKNKPRPTSQYGRLGIVRAVSSHLTGEEIFRRMEADAATYADNMSREQRFELESALDLNPDLPFTVPWHWNKRQVRQVSA